MNSVENIVKSITGKSIVMNHNTFVNIWKSWYKGKVPKFHNYYVYNGKSKVWQERSSLQMAKRVCEDYANLLMNEKTSIITESEQLQKLLKKAKFRQTANESIEKSFALGMGAWLIQIDNIEYDLETGEIVSTSNAKIDIEFVNRLEIYPITINRGVITECAFGDKDYLQIHSLDDKGNYEITFVKNGVIQYTLSTNTDIPLFTIIKPNINNNIDIKNSLGISVYANAIDVLKSVDLIFDSLNFEFKLGRKRIAVSSEMFSINMENGDRIQVFDSNDVLFYLLPTNADGNNMIKDLNTGNLRIDSHEQGLQISLNLLSQLVGLGTNYYKFEKGQLKTATEVISENSDTFRTIKKHEIVLEQAIQNLIQGLILANNMFTDNPMISPTTEITVKFDDSIIEDKNAEMTRDMLFVNAGIMAVWEYRGKWFGEDEAKAKKMAEQLKSSVGNVEDMYQE